MLKALRFLSRPEELWSSYQLVMLVCSVVTRRTSATWGRMDGGGMCTSARSSVAAVSNSLPPQNTW